VALAKEPPGQREHEGALLALLKEPGGHSAQLREVKLAKAPGAQKKGRTRRIVRVV
jgi:hypothetical protein